MTKNLATNFGEFETIELVGISDSLALDSNGGEVDPRSSESSRSSRKSSSEASHGLGSEPSTEVSTGGVVSESSLLLKSSSSSRRRRAESGELNEAKKREGRGEGNEDESQLEREKIGDGGKERRLT